MVVCGMNVFFLVFARDEKHVHEKINELERLGVRYLVICGKRLRHPNVIYRKARGKFDAINFGASFVPKDVEIVALNDVDTKLRNLGKASVKFNSRKVGLVFAKVLVKKGPQRSFYAFLDRIRRRFPISSSGELMLLRRDLLIKILPLMPCKAEDSYILFKALELGQKCIFCEECFVETQRTKKAEQEQAYKRKTVCGIYQALGYARPSIYIVVFYTFLPLFSPLLLILGKKGYFWSKGILLGFIDYLRGDRSGLWQTDYMK
jgi:hypothetical protein